MKRVLIFVLSVFFISGVAAKDIVEDPETYHVGFFLWDAPYSIKKTEIPLITGIKQSGVKDVWELEISTSDYIFRYYIKAGDIIDYSANTKYLVKAVDWNTITLQTITVDTRPEYIRKLDGGE